MRSLLLALFTVASGCAFHPAPLDGVDGGGNGGSGGGDAVDGGDAADAAAADDAASGDDAGDPDACIVVTTAPTVIATAATSDEYALTVDAQSASATSWAQTGNEALVLDVLRGGAVVGHLVLASGPRRASSTACTSARSPPATRSRVRVSTLLGAGRDQQGVRARPASSTSATALGAAGEGLTNAPIFRWPVQKRFDDLPIAARLVEGAASTTSSSTPTRTAAPSRSAAAARAASQAEIARWGRASDIEGIYTYGGASPTLGALHRHRRRAAERAAHRGRAPDPLLRRRPQPRCSRAAAATAQTCGTGGAREGRRRSRPAGTSHNPGNDAAARRRPFIITIRPLPVELDAIGYARPVGRREGVLDTYAPWLYRITDEELAREGKIDGTKSLPMERYLYVDVRGRRRRRLGRSRTARSA